MSRTRTSLSQVVLAAGAVAFWLFSCTSTSQTVGDSWSRAYAEDLQATRDIIAANHPGVVDVANPSFSSTLRDAYREAWSSRRDVVDYDSYRVALTRFANRFQDAHLTLSFDKPFESLREAGILTSYRGGQFVVREVDSRYGRAAATLRGATLLSCDGQDAREHFTRRVLSWRGRPAVEADWHYLAPILFVDYGRPTAKPPSRCRFQLGARTIALPLQWTPTTGERVAAYLAPQSTDERRLSLERIEEQKAIWVDLPTFAVYDDESVSRMRELIESFGGEVARGDWRLIVFDLRGNSGGSSAWGSQLAAALFGAEWTKEAQRWLSDGVYTEWRVSADNAEAVAGNVRQSEQRHGADSTAARNMREFHRIMTEALARGDVMYANARERGGIAPPGPVPLQGRVVVITEPSCFSACLDFLDILRLHPDVVQVGHTTGVDTVYMESWSKPLPSGHARLSYPMKVYRNRRRANNEAYAPAIVYHGSLGDTNALRGWILTSHGGW